MARYEQALAITIKTLGPDTPSVGDTFNNIANVLASQGQFEAAMTRFEQALAIRIKALGPDHPDVGSTYLNMGVVLESQGQLEAAMARYEQALAIMIKALGPDHPSVGDTYYIIGNVLGKQGQNLPRALELFTRSRDIYLAAHGAEHAEVADANGQIARVTAAM